VAVLGRHPPPTEPTTFPNTIAFHFPSSSSMANVTSTFNNTIVTRGWTPSPNGCGTTDIFWSRALTIFQCSWTILYLNIPSSNRSQLRFRHQKNLIAFEGILVPEFISQTVLEQWVSVCHSVKDFTNSGHLQWTTAHTFLADMGGYILHQTWK
jgi:hypothetical protein